MVRTTHSFHPPLIPRSHKEFVQKCALKRHEQTHLDEKLWECDYPNCGKRFKLRVYLDVHKRIHPQVGIEALAVCLPVDSKVSRGKIDSENSM